MSDVDIELFKRKWFKSGRNGVGEQGKGIDNTRTLHEGMQLHEIGAFCPVLSVIFNRNMEKSAPFFLHFTKK